MQLDAVESSLFGAARGRREQPRQLCGQTGDLRILHVCDSLARAQAQRFQLALAQDVGELCIVQRRQPLAHGPLRSVLHAEEPPMFGGNFKKLPEVPGGIRPPADRQEIDELDEQSGFPTARPAFASSARSPGMNPSSPMRSNGPLGTSRIPVASTTNAPGRPEANRSYQATTFADA